MIRVLYVVLLAVLWLFPANAQEKIRLTNGEWKPYQSEELPGYGPYSELVKQAFARVDIEVEFGFFPWNRAMKLVEIGEWDGTFLWAETPERKEMFLLSEPVVGEQEVIYYVKSRPIEATSLSDFTGLVMGRIQSSSFGEKFNPLASNGKLSIAVVPVNDNLFKMLYMGRVDFVPELVTSGYAAIDSLPEEFDKSQFVHLETFKNDWVSHLLVSKNIENGPYFIEAFNKGFKLLQEDGSAEQILAPILKPRHTF